MDAAELFDALFGREIDPEWRIFASCREIDADVFFPREREPAGKVKAICRGCAVQPECLAMAIATGEAHGIWGGLTHRERLHVVRTLRRAGFRIPRWRRGQSAA
ncbi:WhiB family transcriptional regulator [Pseudonocardia sp. H11422]|uniref:WhiB family transcriptional regulator n=1 Tax=Pseudonocardia sp. H11422 TaxID=2835866 RepID=UPI001BDCA770|nr:WhiB family transcriptional regulator [Pseudonocardia sp. H11422]